MPGPPDWAVSSWWSPFPGAQKKPTSSKMRDWGLGGRGVCVRAQPHVPAQPQRGADWAHMEPVWRNRGTLRGPRTVGPVMGREGQGPTLAWVQDTQPSTALHELSPPLCCTQALPGWRRATTFRPLFHCQLRSEVPQVPRGSLLRLGKSVRCLTGVSPNAGHSQGGPQERGCVAQGHTAQWGGPPQGPCTHHREPPRE